MNQNENINGFEEYLIAKESSKNTIEKYLRDVRLFFSKTDMIEYESLREFKAFLMERYAPRSVNSIIAAVNQYLNYRGLEVYRMKPVRVQKELFLNPNKDLGKEEYRTLIQTAAKKQDGRLALLMESICGTGIRISELQYFTVESIKNGIIKIYNKGKARVIMIPHKLKMKLLYYVKKEGIRSGAIFITKFGNPMNRSNIWAMMKKLGASANIDLEKIFPHNLRHLFAKTYYNYTKDISKLADLLGHSSINTTRIYTISTGREHRLQIEQLGLIL